MTSGHLARFWSALPAGQSLQDKSVFHHCCTAEAHFYDRHLDNAFSLKKVVILPTFTSRIEEMSNASVESMVAQGLIDERHAAQVRSNGISFGIGVESVSRQYFRNVAVAAYGLAAGHLLNPKLPVWSSSIRANLGVSGHGGHFSSSETNFQIEHKKELDGSIKLNFANLETLTPREHAILTDLASFCPVLVNFQVFAPTTEANTLMRGVKAQSVFPWQESNTYGKGIGLTSGTSQPLDAPNCSWTTEWIGRGMLRRSSRSLPEKKVAVKDLRAVPKSIVKRTTRIRTKTKSSNNLRTPNHYIQRAWTQSVARNTTFFVFHCGNYMPIGIRNRKTQTLYLSELIDVKDNPHYNRINHGLFVAAIQDSLDRLPFLRTNRHPAPPLRTLRSTTKRPRTEFCDTPPTKRQKLSVPATDCSGIDPFADHTVLLLNVRDTVYNSPYPSMLFRLGTADEQADSQPKSYMLSNCVTLTIHQSVGIGATGHAHSGSISLFNEPPITIVAKLAFDIDKQQRLEHEAGIYERLVKHKVSAVLRFYGCFRDASKMVTVLVLEDVGTPLTKTTIFRDPKGEGDPDTLLIPSPQRDQLFEDLKMIHDAGVVSRDLRPENIALNEETGVLRFFDFDHARLDPPTEKYAKERKDLEDICSAGFYYIGISHTPSPARDSDIDESE